MKNLIYQCYDGPLLPGTKSAIENMKSYAARIGAEYRFDHNHGFGATQGVKGRKVAYFYNCLRPIRDEKFQEYDNVLSVDIDIFAVDGLEANIFDEIGSAEVANCTEPLQPVLRTFSPNPEFSQAADEKWASVVENKWKFTLPRTPEGLLKIYNAGLTLWSNAGLRKASEKFPAFVEYINYVQSKNVNGFQTHDQYYTHAMIFAMKMNHIELDNGWNCIIHHYHDRDGSIKLSDPRTPETKLVQIQLRSADHWDADTQWRIVNRPSTEWKLP